MIQHTSSGPAWRGMPWNVQHFKHESAAQCERCVCSTRGVQYFTIVYFSLKNRNEKLEIISFLKCISNDGFRRDLPSKTLSYFPNSIPTSAALKPNRPHDPMTLYMQIRLKAFAKFHNSQINLCRSECAQPLCCLSVKMLIKLKRIQIEKRFFNFK